MENIENNETVTENIENLNEEQGMETQEEGQEQVEQVLDTSAASDKQESAGKEKAEAAHLAFIAATKAHAESLGLQTLDQKGFFKVWNAETGHKLYVAKQSRGVTRIDTTLPQSELPGMTVDLEKPNGRVTCHVTPTPENVTAALDKLASYSDKIPAPKKPAGKAESAPAQ